MEGQPAPIYSRITSSDRMRIAVHHYSEDRDSLWGQGYDFRDQLFYMFVIYLQKKSHPGDFSRFLSRRDAEGEHRHGGAAWQHRHQGSKAVRHQQDGDVCTVCCTAGPCVLVERRGHVRLRIGRSSWSLWKEAHQSIHQHPSSTLQYLFCVYLASVIDSNFTL